VAAVRYNQASRNIRPLVLPHVSHFMQVPFRTSRTRCTSRFSSSSHYRVEDWEVSDADGKVVDADRMRWDDSDLTFTAIRWELLECSLVTVPADSSASIRSLEAAPGRAHFIADAQARMWARQRMVERMSAND
jgi:hypothetical protein